MHGCTTVRPDDGPCLTMDVIDGPTWVHSGRGRGRAGRSKLMVLLQFFDRGFRRRMVGMPGIQQAQDHVGVHEVNHLDLPGVISAESRRASRLQG